MSLRIPLALCSVAALASWSGPLCAQAAFPSPVALAEGDAAPPTAQEAAVGAQSEAAQPTEGERAARPGEPNAAAPEGAVAGGASTGDAVPSAVSEGGEADDVESATASTAGPEIELTPDDARRDAQVGAGDTMLDRARQSHSRVTLGGYGEHEFIAESGQNSYFRAHRYVLFVHGQISERVSTSTEIEFEFAGSPLKKDGTLGPGEVLLEYSVVDFRIVDWLQFRAGVILMPMGYFNVNHDAPLHDLSERPIAYTTIVPSTWFESGAGFFGKIDLSRGHSLGYEAYVVNGLDARIYDGYGFRAARGSHFEDNNNDKALVARVAYSPKMNFEVGLSGYTGAYDQQKNRVNMGNIDLRAQLGPLKLLAEAVYAKVDPGFVEGFSPGSPANTRDAVPTGMWGYYAQATYRIPVGELFSMPDDLRDAAFNLSARYEAKDTDVDVHSSAGDARRMTLGLSFRPITQFVIKNDFQWNSKGRPQRADAPDIWQADFWDGRETGYRFDTFVAAAAYLF